ncbi:MAG: hypothetical protein ACKO1M_14490 [Planctomycetota bacterium]
MNPIDRFRDGHHDETVHQDQATADGLSAQLARLRPLEPGPDLRFRIGAALVAVERCDSAGASPRRGLGAIAERVAWAAGGAVAASLAFLLAGAVPAGGDPAAVAPVVATGPAEPAPAGPPRVREEAVAWSDEGVRFVDEFTPARVLRRKVVERHLAGDGAAEVRVPREDVILLPVALR